MPRYLYLVPALLLLSACGDTVAKIDEGAAAETECIGQDVDDFGHFGDCSVMTITFRDGSRCVATKDAGTVCQWTPVGTSTTVPPTGKEPLP